MVQWVGWVGCPEIGKAFPVTSGYMKRCDAEKNVKLKVEETYGPVEMEVHLYTLSQADKRNWQEEMELWCRDTRNGMQEYHERNEGCSVGMELEVSPREATPFQDVRRTARELGLKERMAERLMDAYANAYGPDEDEVMDVARKVEQLMRRFAA